jgi:hypothetical protein
MMWTLAVSRTLFFDSFLQHGVYWNVMGRIAPQMEDISIWALGLEWRSSCCFDSKRLSARGGRPWHEHMTPLL